MSLVGIDTNILLRYAVDDENPQSAEARRVLDDRSREDQFFVSHIVLCEFFRVCRTRFRIPRSEILDLIHALLTVASFQVEKTAAVRSALAQAIELGVDFADAVIAESNASNGCAYTLTLDQKAQRLDAMRALEG